MEVSELKKWCDENTDRILKECGLPHWSLGIIFEQNEDAEHGAQCYAYPKYERAKFVLNAPNIVDAEEVFRHEVFHLLHSPFEFYRNVINTLIPDDSKAAVDEVWSMASELTVKNIERMFGAQAKKEKEDPTC